MVLRSDTLDTTQVAPQERFAYFSDAMCARHVASHYSPVGPRDAFWAQVSGASLGAVDVCRIAQAPIRSVRDARMLKANPQDDFFIIAMLAGRSELLQGGRRSVQAPGDLVLLDAGNTYVHEFHGDYELLLGRLPRKMITARLPAAERLTSRTIGADVALASIMRSTLHEAAQLGSLGRGPTPPRLGATIGEVVSATLEFALCNGEVGPGYADIGQRAKQYMLDHLEEPEIDLEQVADALSVSRRTLCRVFAAEDTTAMRWLWRQRLERAYALLSEGRVRRVSDAVMQCGFNDFSHFSRAFKQAYGELPTAVLNRLH